MEKYFNIIKVDWKFNVKYHVILALIFCCSAQLIMGTRNLDSMQSAVVLDMYISLTGVILLVPIFNLEQNENIRDLIQTKKHSILITYIIRILEAFILLAMIEGIFIVYLKASNCQFPANSYYYGVMASSIFLGSIGILVYSISNNVVLSYMLSLLYYIFNYFTGRKYVGAFYLFSLTNHSMGEKNTILLSSIVLLIIAVLYRKKHK